MPVTDPRDAILIAARDRPRADAAEAGYATIRALTATDFSDAALADAVALCVAEGLLRDPVRLEQGALQCYWRAELTPAGVEAARAVQHLSSCPRMRVSTSSLAASKDVDTRIRGHDAGGCDGNDVGPARSV
ncbi:MAG: hypothetical protein ABI224_04585 [Acetobacteraceae bacterium]